jgi:hypothetical protein
MLQKLKITLGLLSFSVLLASVGMVASVSAASHTEFACKDDSTTLTFSRKLDGARHEAVAKCASGAQIIATNYGGHTVVAVDVTCQAGQTVATAVSSTTYAFYCATAAGQGDNGQPGTPASNYPTIVAATPINNCGDNATAECAEAAKDPAATSGNCATPTNCDLVHDYINPLINFLAAAVGVAVTIAIIWGGIEYSSAGGDPQKVSIAKNRIKNAIIALVTFFFLWALLNFLIPGGLF